VVRVIIGDPKSIFCNSVYFCVKISKFNEILAHNGVWELLKVSCLLLISIAPLIWLFVIYIYI